MKQFYLTRLERKPKSERQAYLDDVVVAKYRDEVREAWNEAHVLEPLE